MYKTYSTSQILPCHPFCSACGTAGKSISNFRNLKSCDNYIHHLWCAATSVSQAFGTVVGTYSMHWILSCHPPCDLTSGCGIAGTDISTFRNLETLWQGYSPLVIHSQHYRFGIGDSILGLFDALNLLVLSVLRYDCWLHCCSRRHLPFSEFGKLPQGIHHEWSISSTINWALDIPS